MLFRLPIIKFFNRILNRITVTVVLVALQLAWLAWVFFALTTGTARVWVTGTLNGLSLLIILYLVRKDENSAYKVGWIALIGLLPLLGGSVGGILGMAAFHHKTRHWYFRIGLPVMFLLQAAGAVYLLAR